MAGHRSIDLDGDRGDALWREERRRLGLAPGAANRSRRLRRGIGAGMAALLALAGLAVLFLLAELFRTAGSWFAGTIMPHFLRHDVAPSAVLDLMGAFGRLLGLR